MKRNILKALLLLVLVAVSGIYITSSKGTDTLILAGSTSVQPIAEALGEEFIKREPGVRIDVQGGGSSAGIKAAKSGTADIGMSSRELKPEEADLVQTLVAKDGIAVILHPMNPVKELTLEEIRKIFAGEISNWKELGGPDATITVVTREAGSGTRGAFEEVVMANSNFARKAIVQSSTGAVRQTVIGDINAVGYISLAGLTHEVKSVKIEGIETSQEAVRQGTYKISRPFLFLTKEAPKGLIKKFLDFALSAEGQRICEEEGLIRAR